MQKFKDFVFSFLLLLSVAAINSGCRFISAKSLPSAPCAESITTVENQSAAPASLSIIEAKCEGSYSSIRLILKNVSSKTISFYKLSWITDYENKKAVEDAQANTINLKSGESTEIQINGGFADGTSYGKQVGKLT